MRYKEACADALYSHFFGYMAFEKERKTQLDNINCLMKEARRRFSEAKYEIKELQERFDETLGMTYEEYTQGQKQLPIQFPED